jgi:hypothetical protein
MTGSHAKARSNRIVLQFDSLDDALRLFNPRHEAPSRAPQAAAKIHQALASAGLGLSLRVQGRPVAELGQGEMAGPLLELLGKAA